MTDGQFAKTVKSLKEIDRFDTANKVKIHIPNAKAALWSGIKYFTGGRAEWRNEYDKVAAWLENNQGRGLLVMGSPGTGKTLICEKIIPVLLNHYLGKIVRPFAATEINRKADELLKAHIVYVDDIGLESEKNNFGEKSMVFSDLVYTAEREGKLLICTTNMDVNSIREKYGDRVLDRLKEITDIIPFMGISMRGKF